MAKTDYGFYGKVGPVVGYRWNGRWVLRSRPAAVRNPRTAAQQEHRSAFRQQVQLAARLRAPVVQTLTGLARAEGMTAYNLFQRVNQGAFGMEEGVLTVDWDRVQVSVGDTEGVVFGAAGVAGGEVRVGWESRGGEATDLVYVYAYAPELGAGYLCLPSYRHMGSLRAQLPAWLVGQRLVLLAYVWDEERRMGSMTVRLALAEPGGSADAIQPGDDGTDNNDGDSAPANAGDGGSTSAKAGSSVVASSVSPAAHSGAVLSGTVLSVAEPAVGGFRVPTALRRAVIFPAAGVGSPPY